MHNMPDFIFIAGAPGVGKSTLTKELHNQFKSPFFEFGWIPEFRTRGEAEISYSDEEQLSFENLCLVLKNYAKHGFNNILVTDLEDKRILEIEKVFEELNYKIITLTIANEEELQSRILDKKRQNNFRDFDAAVMINKKILERPLLINEVRVDTTGKSAEEVLSEVKTILV